MFLLVIRNTHNKLKKIQLKEMKKMKIIIKLKIIIIKWYIMNYFYIIFNLFNIVKLLLYLLLIKSDESWNIRYINI